MKHKRLMAILLALAMMITFMPAMAFADTEIEKDSNVKSEEPAEAEPGDGEKSEEAATEESDASLQDVAGAGMGNEVNAQTETENYNLWVGGVRVTSENATNIPTATADGHAEFDSTSNTLKLVGATIKAEKAADSEQPEEVCGIYAEHMNLTIELVGNNVFLNNETYEDVSIAIRIFEEDSSLIIKGNGTLRSDGLYNGISSNSNIEINGSTILINNCSGDAIDSGDGNLIIRSGIIDVSSNDGAGLSGKTVTVTGSVVNATSVTSDVISAGTLDYGTEDGKIVLYDSEVSAKAHKGSDPEILGDGISGSIIDINKSRVDAEGSMGISSLSGITIRNSGSGRYATRVKAKSSGEAYMIGVAPAIFAGFERTVQPEITINDDLKIVSPVNGRVDTKTIESYPMQVFSYKAIFDEYGSTSQNVLIEPSPSTDPLIATMRASGKTDMNLSWNQYAGADGYDI